MSHKHIRLVQGDITRAEVDAIVNAANPAMLGGGGVDGAIHRAAGPALLDACRAVPSNNGVRCPTGEARITHAGELAAKYVIHTVGPRYNVDPDPRELLASAYRNSLELALAHDCRTVALPAISCGVYGYPLDEAGAIAFATCSEDRFQVLGISFYLFGEEIFRVWTALLESAG